MADTHSTSELVIYTDGACSGNPGPGGWGAVLIAGKGHETYQILADETIHFDDREAARQVLARLHDHALDLLYISPERLIAGGFLERLADIDVALFAIKGLSTAEIAARPTYPVQRGNVEDVFSFTGRWQPRDQMTLSFPINGTIRQVNVQRGDAVSAGDLLADLERALARAHKAPVR